MYTVEMHVHVHRPRLLSHLGIPISMAGQPAGARAPGHCACGRAEALASELSRTVDAIIYLDSTQQSSRRREANVCVHISCTLLQR